MQFEVFLDFKLQIYVNFSYFSWHFKVETSVYINEILLHII